MSFALNQFTGFGVQASGLPNPTYFWDFVNQESLTDTIGGQAVSFEREGSGAHTNSWYWDSTGEFKTDTDKTTPRWDHDPADSNRNRGLLIEGGDYGGATGGLVNATSYSYELDSNSWWADTNVIMTTGQTTPDTAGNRGVRFTATSTSGLHWNQSSLTSVGGISVGGEVAFSIHVKNENSTQRYVMLELLAGTNTFRIVWDSIGETVTDSSGAGIRYFAVDKGNGWWQVSVMGPTAGSVNCRNNFYLGDGSTIADHTGAWAGDDSNGILFWGAQLNWRSYVATHKQTSGGDNESDGEHVRLSTGSMTDWVSTEGTLVFEIEIPKDMQYLAYSGGFGDGNTTDYIYCGFDLRTAGTLTLNSRVRASSSNSHDGSEAVSGGVTGPNGDYIHKVAYSFKNGGSFLLSCNGVTMTGTASGVVTPADAFQEYLYIGTLPFGNATTKQGITRGKQWMRKVRWWPTQLTQTQLNELTAA